MDLKSVYVMESSGKVKIGVAHDPQKRLQSLAVGNFHLHLIYESPKLSNSYAIESKLHKMFSDCAVGREWFDIDSVEDVVKAVQRFVDLYGETHKKISHPEYELSVKDGEESFTFSEWIAKTELEVEKMKQENEELQKFVYHILGYEIPNRYTDCIYKTLFGMDAAQLREKYSIGKKDNLRDCFSQEELCSVETMERLVSGLVDLGWGYDRIKEFIQQNNLKQIAV